MLKRLGIFLGVVAFFVAAFFMVLFAGGGKWGTEPAGTGMFFSLFMGVLFGVMTQGAFGGDE